jgi:hypothetical protein
MCSHGHRSAASPAQDSAVAQHSRRAQHHLQPNKKVLGTQGAALSNLHNLPCTVETSRFESHRELR